MEHTVDDRGWEGQPIEGGPSHGMRRVYAQHTGGGLVANLTLPAPVQHDETVCHLTQHRLGAAATLFHRFGEPHSVDAYGKVVGGGA